MQSGTLRAVSRIGALFAVSWRQPVVLRTGCRYLRVPRSVVASRIRRPDDLFDDSSHQRSKLSAGKDWQEQEEAPLKVADADQVSRVPGEVALQTGDATDLLMEEIKRCGALEMILRLVERHDRIMNHNHLARTVEQLFNQIAKRDFLTSQERKNLVDDPRFATLCGRLIRSCRYMSPNATLDVLKLIRFLDVPINSRLSQTYLHLLKEQLNELSLNSLMYASFLTLKFHPNRVAEALSFALPLAFELRIFHEIDAENLPQLFRMLTFSTSFQVSKKTRHFLLKTLRRFLIRQKTNVKNSQETLPLQQALDLFIRLERNNVYDDVILEYLLDNIERQDLSTARPGALKKLLTSVRYLRGKQPAEFPPHHRMLKLEGKLSDLLPPQPESDFSSFDFDEIGTVTSESRSGTVTSENRSGSSTKKS